MSHSLMPALIRKEALSIVKDPKRRLIMVVPVILQSVLFGYVATYDLNIVEYAIVDQDHTLASRELASRFALAPIFRKVAEPPNQAELTEMIDTKRIRAGIVIPIGFEKGLREGTGAAVQTLVDGRNSNVAGAASGYVSEIISQYAQDRAGAAAASPTTSRVWFNPNLESRWNILSGLLAMLSTIQVLILSAMSVATEREQGTFDQLLVTPANSMQILVGKAIPPILLGVLLSGIILVVATGWFHVPLAGRVIDLFAALLIYNVSIVGIGLSLSAICSTIQQAMLSCFCCLVPCVLLSGFASPISTMPEILQFATLANPVRWGVEMMQRIFLEGATLADLGKPIAAAAAISAVTLSTAARLFRRKVG